MEWKFKLEAIAVRVLQPFQIALGFCPPIGLSMFGHETRIVPHDHRERTGVKTG